MADRKQTMYEILGVSQSAALPEIKAAHQFLTRELIVKRSSLEREEIDNQLKILDLALHTLSTQWSRDAYDAELSVSKRALPAQTSAAGSQGGNYNPVVVANAIEELYKKTDLVRQYHETPLTIMSVTASSSASALKMIFRVVGGLLVLGIIFKVSMAIHMAGHQSELFAKEKAKAEEMVAIQDYYQKHGIRPASRGEAEMLELENQRQEAIMTKEALEKKHQDEAYQRFVEESRREGEQITRSNQYAEERALAAEERTRHQAEWEQQQAAEQKRRDEAMAKEQIEEKLRRDREILMQRAD